MDTSSNSLQHATETVATKKAWTTPEIRDQSIRSQTEGGKAGNPSETNPTTGPS
ncbi:hypothetical protein ACH50O_06225 [Methylomonas sp. 2BW1-5-20]|uniref:hypothetical protein n=1 Tax=Methylomonas sp. 2BW1-5-20 TaxID=3376686 RepID=UPI00404DDEC0